MAKEVIIRILYDESGEPNPEATPSSQDKQPQPSGKKAKKEKESQTTAQVFGAYMAHRSWNFIKTEAKYYSNKYMIASEAYREQTLVENAVDTIDFAISTGMIVYAGAKTFAGTALGAAGGGLVALAVTAIAKTAQAIHRYADEAQRIAESAYGNYFYGVRAGFVDGGHGTEN